MFRQHVTDCHTFGISGCISLPGGYPRSLGLVSLLHAGWRKPKFFRNLVGVLQKSCYCHRSYWDIFGVRLFVFGTPKVYNTTSFISATNNNLAETLIFSEGINRRMIDALQAREATKRTYVITTKCMFIHFQEWTCESLVGDSCWRSHLWSVHSCTTSRESAVL